MTMKELKEKSKEYMRSEEWKDGMQEAFEKSEVLLEVKRKELEDKIEEENCDSVYVDELRGGVKTINELLGDEK